MNRWFVSDIRDVPPCAAPENWTRVLFVVILISVLSVLITQCASEPVPATVISPEPFP